MKQLYPIFKRDNAIKLRNMGFPIFDASTNKRNPNYVIYYFEKTDKFLKAFDKLNDRQEQNKII